MAWKRNKERHTHVLESADKMRLVWDSNLFFCFESLSGVSSTTRAARRSASSSQPAMAAAVRNLGLSRPSRVCPFWVGADDFDRDFSFWGVWYSWVAIEMGKRAGFFLWGGDSEMGKEGRRSNGRIFFFSLNIGRRLVFNGYISDGWEKVFQMEDMSIFI